MSGVGSSWSGQWLLTLVSGQVSAVDFLGQVSGWQP